MLFNHQVSIHLLKLTSNNYHIDVHGIKVKYENMIEQNKEYFPHGVVINLKR